MCSRRVKRKRKKKKKEREKEFATLLKSLVSHKVLK